MKSADLATIGHELGYRAQRLPGHASSLPDTTMHDTRINMMFMKLDRLRADLVDLAYELERQRRLDAADVAISTSIRVGELREELAVPAVKAEPVGE